MQPSREGGTSPSRSSLFLGTEGPPGCSTPGRRRDGGRQPWRRLFTDRGITAAVAEGEKRRQQGCDGVIGLPLSQLGKRERGQKRHGGKREEAGKRCVRWEERESWGGRGGQCLEEGMDKTRVGEEKWGKGKPVCCLSSGPGMREGLMWAGSSRP